jgi:hypothetical protein
MGAQTRIGFEEADEIDPILYLLQADLAQSEFDTLLSMPGMKEQQIEVASSTGQRMIFVGPPQFAPRLHWAFSSMFNRVWSVTDREYRLELRNLAGDVIRRLVAPTPDLTVTQRVRDWFFEEEFRFGFGSGEMFSATRESLEKYPFADVRQAIEGIAVDPLGRLWVEANTTEPGVSRLDLFDPEGTYLGHLGELPLPRAFTDDGRALIRIEDEEDADTYLVIAVPAGSNGD